MEDFYDSWVDMKNFTEFWSAYSIFTHTLSIAFAPIDETYFEPKGATLISEEALTILIGK